ncbi:MULTISPECIES: glycosyltransferase family 2 protein [Cyanophyceae]|uniref:Glycosyltransferase n=1 Tax=Leptolyngbya subtilissima DQ-A4 TaxID=2933933 RepID=A0ABV0K5W6_9CYAN|nr:glycosyltransferase family 2 protein [Nodosilinea sp. FACHB-141]MBD2114431.1 glycosyltransferase [Nodosilinea sp. FACHB-141]
MPQVTKIPLLSDLPAPPSGKTGWPWTKQGEPLAEQMLDGPEYPRISIVTPSYNYGQYIEETIRSVLLQGYPNLEFIIIDGGSTDETLDIISSYEPWLSFWCSEPDEGQTDAINKGFERCTGDIFVWLNADDAYLSSTCLCEVADLYCQGNQLIVGACLNVNEYDQELIIYEQYNGISRPQTFDDYVKFWSFVPLPQPAVFIDKGLCDKAFPLNISLSTTMDYQLFLRVLAQNPKAVWVDNRWVKFKYHGLNKTLQTNKNQYEEYYKVASAEAKQVYSRLKRLTYQTTARDFMALGSIISSPDKEKLKIILKVLTHRITLIRLPLFWKVLFKSLLGQAIYQQIKYWWKRYAV